MPREELKRVLLDLYKKYEGISRDIDLADKDPRERKTRHYASWMIQQDLVIKRILDLEKRLKKDYDEGDAAQVERMRNLFDLVRYSRKQRAGDEKVESLGDDNQKQPQMTIKTYAAGNKVVSIFSQSGDEAKEELERLLESRKRRLILSLKEKKKSSIQEGKKKKDHSVK